ncbi:MAG: hypothetical protein QM820_32970 [Minicystis sp.]
MLPRALAAAIVTAAVSWTSAASALEVPTVYDNAQGIPIGSRAAGMGGAYTALACDEAALHYNPASLSCASMSHLELSANAYVIQGTQARGALGRGEDIAAATFHSIPSIVGAVRIIREGSERTRFATYPGRLAFGFAVSVPSSVAIKIDPPHPSERNYASFATRDDLTCGDLGFAYQVNREIAVGVSIGGVLRTAEQHASWLLVRSKDTICPAGKCADYLAYDVDREYTAIGLRFKAGVLFRPIKNFSFGLNIVTPTINLFGSAKENATLTRADGGGFRAVPIRATGSSHLDLPLRIAVGMAYVKKRYTFTGDISVNFPRRVEVAHDMTAERITGVPPMTAMDRTLSLTFQPNINLGASVPFGPTKELNIGFFTDFSSVSSEDVASKGSNRVHMFGGSMTLGFLGERSRVWVGSAAEIGHTTARVPGRGFEYELVSAFPPGVLPNAGDSTLVRWTLIGVLGSNYSFLE